MKYLVGFVTVIYFVLAVLSRKNFSKYKDKGINRFMYSFGHTVHSIFFRRIDKKRIAISIRKTQVTSPKRIDELSRDYIARITAIGSLMFLAAVYISGFLYFILRNNANNSNNVIERNDYQGSVKTEEVFIEYEGEKIVVDLKVNPVCYTEEEFLEKTKTSFEKLETIMLDENQSVSEIRNSLFFPSEIDGFKIEWMISDSETISYSGKVNRKESEATQVFIVARLMYNEYEAEYCYETIVLPKNIEEISIKEILSDRLLSIERENATNPTFELPSDIDGAKVSLNRDKSSLAYSILGIFILVIVLWISKQKSDLKEAGKERDNMLMNQYPSFVNKCSLYISAGLTIKKMFEMIARDMDGSLLSKEILYTLHHIDQGMEEALAYDSLATRISLPAYTRIINHLGQNLRMGTKDLMKIMDDELNMSFEYRKESAKKKGEEASTKLLFPMIILMAVVMMIVVAPAFYSF